MRGLIVRIMIGLEVGVLQRLIHGDTLGWVEFEQALEHVEGFGSGIGVEPRERDFRKAG